MLFLPSIIHFACIYSRWQLLNSFVKMVLNLATHSQLPVFYYYWYEIQMWKKQKTK